MNESQTAWVAGLLEGEGSFMWRKSNSARISCAMTDLDVIKKLQTLCGGKVYATKKAEEHHKAAWVWALHGEEAIKLMGKISDHMGSRRLSKIGEVMLRHEEWKKDKEERTEEQRLRYRAAAQDYLSSGESMRVVAKRHGVSHVTVKNYVDALHNGRCDWAGQGSDHGLYRD